MSSWTDPVDIQMHLLFVLFLKTRITLGYGFQKRLARRLMWLARFLETGSLQDTRHHHWCLKRKEKKCSWSACSKSESEMNHVSSLWWKLVCPTRAPWLFMGSQELLRCITSKQKLPWALLYAFHWLLYPIQHKYFLRFRLCYSATLESRSSPIKISRQTNLWAVEFARSWIKHKGSLMRYVCHPSSPL